MKSEELEKNRLNSYNDSINGYITTRGQVTVDEVEYNALKTTVSNLSTQVNNISANYVAKSEANLYGAVKLLYKEQIGPSMTNKNYIINTGNTPGKYWMVFASNNSANQASLIVYSRDTTPVYTTLYNNGLTITTGTGTCTITPSGCNPVVSVYEFQS